MEMVAFKQFQVDRCTACKGIWFDEFEKKEIQALDGSESLDVGRNPEQQELLEPARMPCPKCGGGRMIRMADLKKAQVSFHSCTVCGGSFFEAGEFRRLKERPSLFKALFRRKS
jgi:Zn-finger nucleic acid-binding protein